MNELERRVQTTLERDAAKAPLLRGAPDRLTTKVRRRQARTSLVGVVAAGLVITLAVAGLRAFDTSTEQTIPVDDTWAGYDVFERTVALGPFTISGPSDWYLIDPRREPRCVADFRAAPGCNEGEVFQLSNYDPGLAEPVCGSAVPRGGAVLSVRYVFPDDEGQFLDDPSFPVQLGAPIDDGPCGPGRYAQSQIDGIRTVAWMGTGAGLPDEDIAELERTFDRLVVRPRGQEAPAGDADRSSYVIAGGENAAGPWRLVARPSLPAANPSNVELELVSSEGGSLVGGFELPSLPIQQAGGDPTFGAVTKLAASVELRADGVSEATRIVPVPPTLHADFDLFFGPHEGDVAANAIPLDSAGEPIGTPYEVPTILLASDGQQVIQRFDAFGEAWELVASRTGDRCDVRRVGEASSGTCALSVESGDSYAFVYGTLPNGASTAHVITADGRELPCVVLAPGPSGGRYFVVPLTGRAPGELRMVRRDGSILRHQDLDWGDEPAIGPPIDPGN